MPSLAIGLVAYGAGELLLGDDKKSLRFSNKSLYEVLEKAKEQNKEIYNIMYKIEDARIQVDVFQIHENVEKIIQTINAHPNKLKKINSFFDYYLPVTVKILRKYDEIENQKLSTKDGKEFMNNGQKMLHELNISFEKQLAKLYQSDIVDADAEMKVLDSMLKADGYTNEGLDISNKEEK